MWGVCVVWANGGSKCKGSVCGGVWGQVKAKEKGRGERVLALFIEVPCL